MSAGSRLNPPSPELPPLRGDTRVSDVERIFREHNDSLVRFIAARLGSKQEAAEVAQEAYVRLLSLDHEEAVSYLRAFLFKTAANLATDRLRVRSRRGFMTASVEKAVFELSPERELEGEQAVERLRQAIDELPQKCREAFLLYRLEELSCADIAVRLGLQERMVWRYIARALEYIRVRVKGESGERAP
ncbi:RNA polymerase sigma factor [Steroidobacter sp.]|uniref:RNA polymerase sigma factor n=1 Tax=Steroidobacter sp. TaxID=1978227 RepID=UPI001A40332B|nr:sigma-70 family RNA polymerase sigma factor [Steroidobacter sp.]MBL8268740.1 sigma-70 family RNA polymerase sigma factor [Steroidobacter sp.]